MEERLHAQKLQKASSFLKNCYLKKSSFFVFGSLFILGIVFSILSFLPKDFGFFPFAVFLVFLAVVFAFQNLFLEAVFTKLVFHRYYQKFPENVNYAKQGKSTINPPLFLALANFQEGGKSFNLRTLLEDYDSIALKALTDVGGSLTNSEICVMTHGLSFPTDLFITRPNFFKKLAEMTKVVIESIHSNMEEVVRYATTSTGEFGMLRDSAFLRNLKEAPENSTYEVYGNIGDIDQPTLDDVLTHISKMAEEDNEPTERLIDESKKEVIRHLINQKKLALYLIPIKPKEPHMALVGKNAYVQQSHVHTKPSSRYLFFEPSLKLTSFMEAYLNELKNLSDGKPISS